MKNKWLLWLATVVSAVAVSGAATAQTDLSPEIQKRIVAVLEKEECLDYAQIAESEWGQLERVEQSGPISDQAGQNFL
ncbi:MAG: hypothetical protein IOD12_16625 [Silvanigrellales bacterium]|jgi:hypothetical protein|nr:hypothetical protein [Silvanigrellales bacterium]